MKVETTTDGHWERVNSHNTGGWRGHLRGLRKRSPSGCGGAQEALHPSPQAPRKLRSQRRRSSEGRDAGRGDKQEGSVESLFKKQLEAQIRTLLEEAGMRPARPCTRPRAHSPERDRQRVAGPGEPGQRTA